MANNDNGGQAIRGGNVNAQPTTPLKKLGRHHKRCRDIDVATSVLDGSLNGSHLTGQRVLEEHRLADEVTTIPRFLDIEARIDLLEDHRRRIEAVGEAEPPAGEGNVVGLLHQINRRLDQFDCRFEQIDRRFEQIDRRFEQIDRRFEQIDRRFEQIDRRLDQFDRRFEQIDRRFEQIDQALVQLQHGEENADSRRKNFCAIMSAHRLCPILARNREGVWGASVHFPGTLALFHSLDPEAESFVELLRHYGLPRQTPLSSFGSFIGLAPVTLGNVKVVNA
jgi:chaperonin cofactor prefoldin